MQKLHSARSSKVGSNKAATNNFIFECTPFLLFETDVLTDFWVEANTCYIGQLHLQLRRYSSALAHKVTILNGDVGYSNHMTMIQQ